MINNGRAKDRATFREDNGNLSRTFLHYLEKIGRAPHFTQIGGKEIILPEDEEAWRSDMRANPIKGSLRRLAEAAKKAAAADTAKAA